MDRLLINCPSRYHGQNIGLWSLWWQREKTATAETLKKASERELRRGHFLNFCNKTAAKLYLMFKMLNRISQVSCHEVNHKTLKTCKQVERSVTWISRVHHYVKCHSSGDHLYTTGLIWQITQGHHSSGLQPDTSFVRVSASPLSAVHYFMLHGRSTLISSGFICPFSTDKGTGRCIYHTLRSAALICIPIAWREQVGISADQHNTRLLSASLWMDRLNMSLHVQPQFVSLHQYSLWVYVRPCLMQIHHLALIQSFLKRFLLILNC